MNHGTDHLQDSFRQVFSLHQRGKLADAERGYEEILRRHPHHFEALHFMGVVALQTGRAARGADLIGRAIMLKPRSSAAHSNLGLALCALNRIEEALASYGRAIGLDPAHAEARNNRGNALRDLRRYQEALADYDMAIALKPNLAEAHNNRGNVLQALKRHPEAIGAYEKAISLKPDYAEAHSNLGDALYRLDRSEEAVVRLRRATVLAPGLGEAHHHLGTALMALGRLDEARGAIERAIALAPRRPEFYRALGRCKVFAAGDRHLAALEEMVPDLASFGADDRVQLHFALAKALADVGLHARSFDHLLAGNALKRAQIVYREAGVLDLFDRLRRVFTPALLRTRAGQGDPSAVPVFIVGMPRSGTTLIEQILASHPSVFGAGEIDAFQAALSEDQSADDTALSSREQLRRLGARYLDRVRPRAPRAARITDKMPGNFAFVGLIHLALPNARIIHARRDPVDTCLSCFSQLFTEGQHHTYELGELGRYYRGYAALMAHWRTVLPPGVMLEVQYEEVVADIEHQARRIVAHCGLGWDDACLAFHETRRSVATASASQVRQPIYRSSVGRWLSYKDRLRPLLDALAGSPGESHGLPGAGGL